MRFTGENADIFDAGTAGDDLDDVGTQPRGGQQPAPQPPAGDDDDLSDELHTVSADDAAVSAAIRNLNRGFVPPPPPPARPASVTQPQAGTAPPNEDEPEDRTVAGLMRALLDERGKRQTLEGQLTRYTQQGQDATRPQTPERPQFGDRLFTEPDEVLNEVRTELSNHFASQLQGMHTTYDLRLASMRHGDAFQTAWNDWYGAVSNLDQPNPELYHLVMSSPSPGEALMQWHRNKQQSAEIGDDFDAFKAKVVREAFEAAGIPVPEQFGGQAPRNDVQAGQPSRDASGRFAPSQPQARRFPTATSRMGQSGNGMHENAEDGSDNAIFDSGKPKRSRDD